jgi:tetraacyldisaccharide 4'-kinase
VSALLAPLSSLYSAGAALKNLAYDRGWAVPQRLQWPVVSVGNVCAGGAGKTPVVIALARLLKERGMRVDVLSRGYGRRSPTTVEQVEPDGDSARFGDEPMLIAQVADVPVYVGASRWAAGQLAESSGGPAGVHLLDDGFQHRKLARSFDLVVVHPDDLSDQLLPAGRLREGIAGLRRADALVLRHDDEESHPALLRAGVNKPIWRIRRAVVVPALTGPAVAFCGIAHPGEFFRALELPGVELAARLPFADHHAYTSADMQRIRAAVSAQPHAVLLTTEKDFARISPVIRAELEVMAQLIPVPLIGTLLEPDVCLEQLFAACGLPYA